MRSLGLIVLAAWMSACGLGEALSTDDGTTASEPGTSGTPTSAGGTETETETETETGAGMDLPDYSECEAPDGTTTVGFTVAIDGIPIEIDYSQWDAPFPSIPRDWNNWDLEPEIDGTCAVTSFTPDQGLLALVCPDAQGVERTVELTYSSSVALAPDFAIEQVQLFYIVQYNTDELEANPDTTAHGLVLSTDAGLVLAGIDGRFSTYGSPAAAWPASRLSLVLTPGLCPEQDLGYCELLGRARLTVDTSAGDSAVSFDGGSAPLGDDVLVVETALEQRFVPGNPVPDECCCGEQSNRTTLRLLVGAPA